MPRSSLGNILLGQANDSNKYQRKKSCPDLLYQGNYSITESTIDIFIDNHSNCIVAYNSYADTIAWKVDIEDNYKRRYRHIINSLTIFENGYIVDLITGEIVYKMSKDRKLTCITGTKME